MQLLLVDTPSSADLEEKMLLLKIPYVLEDTSERDQARPDQDFSLTVALNVSKDAM